jgi:hypothetical protein
MAESVLARGQVLIFPDYRENPVEITHPNVWFTYFRRG